MQGAKRKMPDFAIFFVTLLLLTIGLVMVFSASAVSAYLDRGDSFFYLKRQLRWALVGIVVMIGLMNFNYYRIRRYANLGLLFSIMLLVLVLVVGTVSHGSSRWLDLGIISFQPSELIKLLLVIFLAKSLSDHQEEVQNFFKGVLPHIAITGFICLLILLQPDLGTALSIAGTAYLMLIAAGARATHLVILALVGAALVPAAIVMEPYRLKRITAFLNPWADPMDSGFQIIQSLLALGSGGLMGMGLGQSRQKFFYLPERHTDFIYAILGEELGFIGASFVLLLFAIFLWRGFKIALSVKDNFGSLLAVGITSMIILQMIINIGVVTGSMPVTGITLPLISYGGSSLVFTLAGIGILLNISRFSGTK
ncbi:MAG: stage V sporulation protein E [Clostridia bacterium]|nr:stage V sporulation protein E [Clostridia bacterium]